MRRLLLTALLGGVLLGTAACTPAAGAPGGSPTPSAAASARTPAAASRAPAAADVPTPAHVVVVVEENHSSEQASSMPYLSELARTGADFTNSHAVAHPSEPNYLALWSGSTHGLDSDACPLSYGSAPNLGAQLIASGRNAVAYAQGLPEAGSAVCSAGAYARKHVPLADFAATADAAHLKPFSAFPSDFSTLPAVSLVIPDLDHDAHNGTLATADAWLKDNLGGYATWARTHDSLLVVTFDEDDHDTADNHILTVVTGQHVRPGTYSDRIDHVRVLHTLEAAFGLPPLGPASPPITDLWQ